MNKVLWGVVALTVVFYLLMGVYCIQETVLFDRDVAAIMEILLKTKWEEICNLVEEEKGGKTKYRYDCGDKPEKLGEEIRKAAQTLQAKNMGMVIFDIPVRISRNAHNPPRIDPIRVWGIDFFWPLRESPHPSEAEH